MHYDTLGTIVFPGSDQAEEMLPSLSYRQLAENLGQLAELGVLVEGSLPVMLVVARLVDRRRILQSGMSSVHLRAALEEYRYAEGGRPVRAIEAALERAIEIVREVEAPGAVPTYFAECDTGFVEQDGGV